MRKLLLNVILIGTLGFYACNNAKRNEREEVAAKEFTALDVCERCRLDSFYIKSSVKTAVSDQKVISKPTAVEFFNLTKLMSKYHNNDSYDTLMKLFKMKDWGDRNKIYELIEQDFYYKKEIKPILVQNSVNIIASTGGDQFLKFESNDSFFVDVTKYLNEDGVLMFKPGKRPIFWTFKKEKKYCTELYGLVQKYYECPD